MKITRKQKEEPEKEMMKKIDEMKRKD